MKVANIVFDGEINEVNAKLVNFVSGVENDSLPTLIIGWDIAQGYDVKITNHHIGEKLWWTFSPLERRSIYLKDVSKFVGHAIKDLVSGIKYKNIDPIVQDLRTLKSMIAEIRGASGISAYLLDERIIYIYADNMLYGIDLKVIDLIGFKRESLIKKVKEIAEIYSDDGEVHERYKEYLDYIHDDPKYIPYFMYLENGRR
mgnify:CR=1 FL=1